MSKPNVRSPMCSVGYNSDTLSIGIGPLHWVAVRSDYLAIMMIMMMMMVVMMMGKRISNQNHSILIEMLILIHLSSMYFIKCHFDVNCSLLQSRCSTLQWIVEISPFY